jgi:hypothetical protein
MQRPKRACTERAKQKIQEILEWESCKESSQMFKDAAKKLQAELCGEKKQKDYAPSSTSESDDESEEAESEETDSGAETQRSESNSDSEKKAAAFESEAVEILERTCSHSPN